MDEMVRSWLARQIRVLREDRGWSQQDLAAATGLKQSAVSRLEDPDYGRYALSTLLKLRSAFDVGLEVKFVEYGAAVARSRDVSRSALKVCTYHAEQLRPQIPAAGTAVAEVHIEYVVTPKLRPLDTEKLQQFWDYRPKEVV
jgi:Predicted transcriptional regulators